MANGNRLQAQAGQLGEVLQGLLQFAGQKTKGTGQALKQSFEAQNPLNLINDLISQASAQSAQQALRESAAGTEQRLQSIPGTQPGIGDEPQFTNNLEALKDEVSRKRIVKKLEADADEVLQQPGGVEFLSDKLSPQPGVISEPTQALIPEQSRERNFGQKFRGEIGNILRGFQQGFAQDFRTQQLANQQAQRELDAPAELGKREELRIKHENAIALEREKSRLEGLTPSEEELEGRVFKNEFGNLVTSFQNLGLTGPVRGRITLPGIPEITTFEAAAEKFVFSAAGFLAGQKAKGLSNEDVERLTKSFKFERNFTASKFEGKLQFVINEMNARLKASNKPVVPDAKSVIQNIKQGKDPFTGQSTQQGGQQFKSGSKFTSGRFQVEVE